MHVAGQPLPLGQGQRLGLGTLRCLQLLGQLECLVLAVAEPGGHPAHREEGGYTGLGEKCVRQREGSSYRRYGRRQAAASNRQGAPGGESVRAREHRDVAAEDALAPRLQLHQRCRAADQDHVERRLGAGWEPDDRPCGAAYAGGDADQGEEYAEPPSRQPRMGEVKGPSHLDDEDTEDGDGPHRPDRRLLMGLRPLQGGDAGRARGCRPRDRGHGVRVGRRRPAVIATRVEVRLRLSTQGCRAVRSPEDGRAQASSILVPMTRSRHPTRLTAWQPRRRRPSSSSPEYSRSDDDVHPDQHRRPNHPGRGRTWRNGAGNQSDPLAHPPPQSSAHGVVGSDRVAVTPAPDGAAPASHGANVDARAGNHVGRSAASLAHRSIRLPVPGRVRRAAPRGPHRPAAAPALASSARALPNPWIAKLTRRSRGLRYCLDTRGPPSPPLARCEKLTPVAQGAAGALPVSVPPIAAPHLTRNVRGSTTQTPAHIEHHEGVNRDRRRGEPGAGRPPPQPRAHRARNGRRGLVGPGVEVAPRRLNPEPEWLGPSTDSGSRRSSTRTAMTNRGLGS